MYSAKNEDSSQPPPDAGKFIKLGIIAIIGIIIFALAGNQAVVLSMNVTEFADVFTKPLMFSLIGGISLASIALLRVNAVKRSSIFWFFINTAINMMNRGPQDQVQQTVPNFSEYKLSGGHFALWQVTKILLLGAFFANLMFGFGLLYLRHSTLYTSRRFAGQPEADRDGRCRFLYFCHQLPISHSAIDKNHKS